MTEAPSVPLPSLPQPAMTEATSETLTATTGTASVSPVLPPDTDMTKLQVLKHGALNYLTSTFSTMYLIILWFKGLPRDKHLHHIY